MRHKKQLQNRQTLTHLTLGLWAVAVILGIWGNQLEWSSVLSMLAGCTGTLIGGRLLWKTFISEEW